MSNLHEGLVIVGVYLFFLSAVSLPFLIAYFSMRISKVIKKADKLVDYATEQETEARKYHE
jgi:hypothetical protein